jgi:predicted AlkP superfamily pyrophosphatase or phosphodiesterase
MLESGAITRDVLNNWRSSNILQHDEYWMRAAVHIIENHKPNLLMVHLLTTDSVQHQTGAKTLASNTALVLADRQVQRILDAVDRAGIRDTTTIFVVSDHGFKAYHHTIRLNSLLKEKGLLRTAEDCDGWVIPEGGTAMVYVTREEKRNLVLDAFRAPIPGVAQVIAPADYEKWGFPKVTPNGRMADLVLAAASDYAFDGGIEGAVNADVPGGGIRGAHGYLNTDPEVQAILVAWGAGIKVGVKTAPRPNVDVAATIAQLLGVEFPGIQGRPLTDFLK